LKLQATEIQDSLMRGSVRWVCVKEGGQYMLRKPVRPLDNLDTPYYNLISPPDVIEMAMSRDPGNFLGLATDLGLAPTRYMPHAR